MKIDKQTRRRTITNVVRGRLARRDAAKILGVSLRSVHNYVTRYLQRGPEGLLDRRRGHFRKIGPDQEVWIVTCKLDGRHRSARWIRDRLKLPVSAETIRRVLLKHQLDRTNSQPRSVNSRSQYRWDPF